jgi:hypothetical protein
VKSQSESGFPSRVFGGYTRLAWDSVSGYKNEPGCLDGFIFTLCCATTGKPKKYDLTVDGRTKAIWCGATYGPIFGGHDLLICDQCNASRNSYSNIGTSYYRGDGPDEERWFHGTYNFRVEAIEVWQIAD